MLEEIQRVVFLLRLLMSLEVTEQIWGERWQIKDEGARKWLLEGFPRDWYSIAALGAWLTIVLSIKWDQVIG